MLAGLATAGAPAPALTPELVARSVAEIFGLRVVLIEPDAAIEVLPADAPEPTNLPAVHLVVDHRGHVLPTVLSETAAGRVLTPAGDDLPDDLRDSDPDPAGAEPRPDAVRIGSGGGAGDDETATEPAAPPPPPDVTTPPTGNPATHPAAGSPAGATPPGGTPPVASPPPPAAVDPMLVGIGLPKSGLPQMPQLVEAVRGFAQRHNVALDAAAAAALPARLLANYRAVTADGLIVPVGDLDLLIRLEASDLREVPSAVTPDGPSGEVISNEVIQGTFRTGGHSESTAQQAGALRLNAAFTASLGVGPGLLNVARLGLSAGGTANSVTRTSSAGLDAETGHVEDTRGQSTLYSLQPRWSYGWIDRSTPVGTTDPERLPQTADERLYLWIPDHYVQPAPTDVVRASDAPGRRHLPETFFASGVTRLPELYRQILAELARTMPPAEVAEIRHELAVKVWNLDTHLDTAVNDASGYRFNLSNRGRAVATVTISAELTAVPTRFGTTSRIAHLEKVRTQISGYGTGVGLTNESAVRGSLEFGLLPVPAVSLGARIYAAWSATNSEGASANRIGLWVLVSRYTGHTVGYRTDLSLTARVATRAAPESVPEPTPGVNARALLRVPEPAAFEHGFPVDREALLGPPATGDTVPFQSDAVRRDGPAYPVWDVGLPHHVRLGHGIGQGLARVDRDLIARLRNAVERSLRQHDFLPRDPDRPFLANRPPRPGRGRRLGRRAGRTQKLRNAELLDRMISGDGLDSHYDQLHQDGVSFVLRRPHEGARTARITIRAVPVVDLADDLRDPETNNSIYFVRRTGEYHTVNLGMGLDIAGQSAGGGQRISVGAGVAAHAAGLQNLAAGLGYVRAMGATDAVATVINRPELLEYPGDVDEYRIPSRYTVTIEYGDAGSAAPTEIRETGAATVHLIPYFNSAPQPATDPSPAPEPQLPAAPELAPATDPRVLDRAVVHYLDATGLQAAARQVLPEFTGADRSSDQQIVNFTSRTSVAAHFKEMLENRYSTDGLFVGGAAYDRYGSLRLGVRRLGPRGSWAPPRQVRPRPDQARAGAGRAEHHPVGGDHGQHDRPGRRRQPGCGGPARARRRGGGQPGLVHLAHEGDAADRREGVPGAELPAGLRVQRPLRARGGRLDRGTGEGAARLPPYPHGRPDRRADRRLPALRAGRAGRLRSR
ncbi:hypothetical protein [Plantactinospora sp. KBS50]|uniref:hypothetical protein n=1 Tax=Plantactinospora sp. KBS50 TaxID=2024580 RepID=UPI000BAAB7B3|nr:hypothetical protein [Plantactinospora sp. KBS50]ASW55412.1 hypothetical protein CIK06_16405 [Plantactinospora sp. KBS50]